MIAIDTNSLLWFNDPVRPADWRNQRALQLANTAAGEVSPDPTIQAIVRDLRDEGADSAAAREILADVQAARQLRLFDRAAATEIEARILARQSHAQIAEILGIQEGVVQAYADCYFDVANLLDSTWYITSQAIFSRGSLVAPALPTEAYLRWLGYTGGPIPLEAILPYFEQIPSWLSERAERSMVVPRTEEERIIFRMRAIFRLWYDAFRDRMQPVPASATPPAAAPPADVPRSESHGNSSAQPRKSASLTATIKSVPSEDKSKANAAAKQEADLLTTMQSYIRLNFGVKDQPTMIEELLQMGAG